MANKRKENVEEEKIRLNLRNQLRLEKDKKGKRKVKQKKLGRIEKKK